MTGSFTIIKTSAKQSVAWRASMLLSLLTGPLYLLVNYYIWKAVYESSGQAVIGGLTFDQMIIYLVISLITFYALWDDANTFLAAQVRDGNFSSYLLKPLSYLRFAFMWKVGHRLMAIVLEFIPVLLLMLVVFGSSMFVNANWIAYIAQLLIAFIASFLTNFIMGLLAFWFVRVHGFMSLYRMVSGLLAGIMFPLSLYPQVIQKILLFTPFPFIAYVPARIFFGEVVLGGVTFSSLQIFLYGLVHCVLLFVLAKALYKVAIRRFQGVGA